MVFALAVLFALLAVMIEIMFRGATAFVVGVIVVFMVNSSCMYRWRMDDWYSCVRCIFFFSAFMSQYRKPAPAPRLEQVFDGGARPVSFCDGIRRKTAVVSFFHGCIIRASVELPDFEPGTYCLQSSRAISCAIAPLLQHGCVASSLLSGSNRRPAAYKAAALTI